MDLTTGETVIVGRAPTTSDEAERATLVEIASPSVSASHLRITREGTAITLLDEHSRNGTWVRLPPGEPVRVHTAQAVKVCMGSRTADDPALRQPQDAQWTGASDYPHALRHAIEAWLEQQGGGVRVSLVESASGLVDRELPGRIPVTRGIDLAVVPLRTMDSRWEAVLEVLWAYVTAQNLIFTTEEHTRGEGLVLASPVMRRVHRDVVEAAQRGIRVHLHGPSGSGKDGLARCYHRTTARSGTFVAKNCAMFSREFLRSELFGAERGSFTGAIRTIAGAVERAHGGTLFLDEIGDISADVQAMLLTFLDRGQYERFGSDGVLRTADVRLVTATNRDLKLAVAARTFREDLWYRIAGRVIEVPPLSERPEDVTAYLQSVTMYRDVSAYDILAPAARQRLLQHSWPGNFRELRSFIDHLPHEAMPESVSVGTATAILQRTSTAKVHLDSKPHDARPDHGVTSDTGEIARHANDAFVADVGHPIRGWDDVKQYVENFLKPFLFASLTGLDKGERIGAEQDLAVLAEALEADRGTVRKQLARYRELIANMTTRSVR